ncbi:MAG: lysine--tRNA ligase [Candidatus Magasanikbacteria bacterium]
MTKESNIDINDERSVRMSRLEDLRDKGINPYPSQSERTHTVEEALAENHDTEVVIAGRLMAKRDFGKIIFGDIKDRSGTLQIVFKHEEAEEELMDLFSEKADLGDILEIEGKRFKTEKDEESILVEDWSFLAKSLRPLPEKYHGLQDKETKLRKRYLDFIDNPKQKALFERKAKFWKKIRKFMMGRDFLEVQTPVLEKTPGGADAEAFKTYHNALDMDVYLRISMGELWQKRLMVGGFEKTFELGRQFRNEGMSREHLQDYTQMEFYWAYADYEDSMDLVESLFKNLVQDVWSKTNFDINGFKDIEIDQDWDKIDFVDTIKDMVGINVLEASKDELKDKLDELGREYEEFDGKGRLMDNIWKHCRKDIKGPCFLVNHPVEVSPLAKRKEDNPDLTERYQVLIAGSEIANGYSELNDPIDQKERFERQAKLREQGDSEAQMHDKDFVEALEHGMPPTTGFGMSVRVFSFFEDKPIRECVMFPLTRKKDGNEGQIKVSHAVILDNENIPNWLKLNTTAHLSASLAARKGEKMISVEDSITKDKKNIPMNTKDAIVVKETESQESLHNLKQSAEDSGLDVTCFTEEMKETSNNKKIKERQEKKKEDEIKYYGILVHGPKKEVEDVTGKFDLAD